MEPGGCEPERIARFGHCVKPFAPTCRSSTLSVLIVDFVAVKSLNECAVLVFLIVLANKDVFMNYEKSGKEEFEKSFTLSRQNPRHDFDNGLTVDLIENWGARSAGAGQVGPSDPDWGEMCFYMNVCSVIFTFATPVSKVGFSVVRQSLPKERSLYRINEVGLPEGAEIPMPVSGGAGNPAKDVLFESALGIKSFVIEHFYDASSVVGGSSNDVWSYYLFLDNLRWE